jgi:hypothetical protein
MTTNEWSFGPAPDPAGIARLSETEITPHSKIDKAGIMCQERIWNPLFLDSIATHPRNFPQPTRLLESCDSLTTNHLSCQDTDRAILANSLRKPCLAFSNQRTEPAGLTADKVSRFDNRNGSERLFSNLSNNQFRPGSVGIIRCDIECGECKSRLYEMYSVSGRLKRSLRGSGCPCGPVKIHSGFRGMGLWSPWSLGGLRPGIYIVRVNVGTCSYQFPPAISFFSPFSIFFESTFSLNP